MSSTFLSNMDAGNVSHYLALANITPTSTFGTAPTTIATITVQPESFPDPGQMITWRGILMATATVAGSFTIEIKSNSTAGLVFVTSLLTSKGGLWEVRMTRKDASNCIQLAQAFLGVYQDPDVKIRAISDSVPITFDVIATVDNASNSITAVQSILGQP
jgi:hypothetical protein